MVTIYGELYENDFSRKDFAVTLPRLEDIVSWVRGSMKHPYRTGETYYIAFPGLRAGTAEDASRIIKDVAATKHLDGSSFSFMASNHSPTTWIYAVKESSDRYLYSTGQYTQGEKYMSPRMAEVFTNLWEEVNHPHIQFDDAPVSSLYLVVKGTLKAFVGFYSAATPDDACTMAAQETGEDKVLLSTIPVPRA
jgi:hypothetical protein